MVVLCSAVALALGHSFCKWLYRQIVAEPATKSLPGTWPGRWTFALYGGFWLLFVIVMTASGLARTTTWFFQFDQPLYQPRPSYYAEMSMVEGQIAMAEVEAEGDVTEMRARLLDNRDAYGPPRWEQYHILLLPGPSNRLQAAIFYPRNSDGQRRIGFRVFGDNSLRETYPMDKLVDTISHLERAARERAGTGDKRGSQGPA